MSSANRNPDNVETVDSSRHAKIRIKANPGFSHAKTQHIVGIVLSELAVCSSNYPVVFIQRPDEGRFLMIAMLGLRAGENIYHGEEYWDSTYVPLAVQRHPFLVAYDDRVPDGSQVTTCLEMNSPFVGEKDGIPLFHEDGSETDFLKSRQQLLNRMFESQKLTDQFAQTVADLELLKPFDLLLQQQNGEMRKASGLFTLDEMKLKSLRDEQLLELHKRDFLPPCYLVLASLHQLSRLIRTRNRKGRDQIVNFRIEFNPEQGSADSPAPAA